MTFDAFHEFAMSLPGATEMVQWGADLLFKVGDKAFIFTGFNPPYPITFKASDDEFAELIEREGFSVAAYVGRFKWVSIDRLDRVGDKEMRRLVEKSYSLIRGKLPKKLQSSLPPYEPT